MTHLRRGAAGASLLALLACTEPPRSNLVLVVVDTLRADALGCYGQDRPTSPRLDRLSGEGVLFERALATAPWTMPSIASILTGQLPSRHGVVGGPRALPRASITLAERLRAAGYRTGAVTSHILVAPRYGFQQGFESFDQRAGGHRATTGGRVTDAAIEKLDAFRQGDSAPFFLFVHYFDPHYAWVDHAGTRFAGPAPERLRESTNYQRVLALRHALGPAEIAHLRALYDEEVRYADEQIGRLLDALEERDLSRRTWIAVTADHGEEFMEHGWIGHTTSLHDTLLHVPLILRAPGDATPPRRVATPVSLAGLSPTLLELLDVPAPADAFDAASFAALLHGGPAPEAPLVAEVDYRKHPELRTSQRMLLEPPFKLIEDRLRGRVSLYDLASDPGERTDLAAARPDVVARLRERLAALETSLGAPAAAPDLDAEERGQLRNLGYLP